MMKGIKGGAFALLLCTLGLSPAWGEEPQNRKAFSDWEVAVEGGPFADWSVYTVVSNGPKRWEGDKIRAVLMYGESGAPYLMLESIHVDWGWLSSYNKVLWKKRVNTMGDLTLCSEAAESWCGVLSGLRWEGDDLKYEIENDKDSYVCTVTEIRNEKMKTTCR